MACNANPIPNKNTLVVCRSLKNAELLLRRTADKMNSIGLNIRVDKPTRTILILGFGFEIKFISERIPNIAYHSFFDRVMSEAEFEKAMDQIILDAYNKKAEKEIKEEMATSENITLLRGAAYAVGNTNPDEEWIWVEGYKGTDKDMCCKEYQYELHKVHEMPEGSDISVCSSGFHFCPQLKPVFSYYRIGNGNRYFRVRALVRKSDLEDDACKLTSKAIEFLYELEPKEILANSRFADLTVRLTEEEQRLVLEKGIDSAMAIIHVKQLIALGYSEAFAAYIVNCTDRFEVAFAVGHEKELSMDMKVLCTMVCAAVNAGSVAQAASNAGVSLKQLSRCVDKLNDMEANQIAKVFRF